MRCLRAATRRRDLWARLVAVAATVVLIVAIPSIILSTGSKPLAPHLAGPTTAPVATQRASRQARSQPQALALSTRMLTSTRKPTVTLTVAPSPTPTLSRPPAAGPPTRIVAPSIRLDAPVTVARWQTVRLGDAQVRQWVVPAVAAGFHEGSAYPGQPGNTVISGHHNIGAQVFRYLIDLELGDPVTLYVGQARYDYRVTDVELLPDKGMSDEVRIQNARWIAPTADERLTLVTCWPYSGNSHRLIVVAYPLP